MTKAEKINQLRKEYVTADYDRKHEILKEIDSFRKPNIREIQQRLMFLRQNAPKYIPNIEDLEKRLDRNVRKVLV